MIVDCSRDRSLLLHTESSADINVIMHKLFLVVVRSGLIAALVLPFMSLAASTTTDAVGFVSMTIRGTQGVVPEATSYVSLPMVHPVRVRATVASVDGGRITLKPNSESKFDWAAAALDASWYIEISSGNYAGVAATIQGSAANEVTTHEDLSEVLSPGDLIVVRQYVTLGDVFGVHNRAGLGSGTSAAEADTITLVDPRTKAMTVYYYHASDSGAVGWVTPGDPEEKSATPIFPDTGFIVRRKAADDLQVVLPGHVPTQSAVMPIERGLNLVAARFPVDRTLNEIFPAGGPLTGGEGYSETDTVAVPDQFGQLVAYRYRTTGPGGPGWYGGGEPTPVGDQVVIRPGDLLLVNRSHGEAVNYIQTAPYNL